MEKLVIIGSGPAGLTAGLYAGRALLSPLILEGKEPGGQLMGTSFVENWPGEISILGPTLMKNMRNQALHCGARIVSEELVKADLSVRPFVLTTSTQTLVKTHALIIATGASFKRLNCKGESDYWGKGVSTCAVCDGPLYRDKPVVIVGGGDSAMENASFLSNFTTNITIVHLLPQLTASPSMQQRVLSNPRIHIIYESTVTELEGDGKRVTHAVITNQKTGEKTLLRADGVFISIGLSPNTGLFREYLETDPFGYLTLKNGTETSVRGVFAAGDAVDNRYRQAITSAGTGCSASLDAERYLHGPLFKKSD
ncbi:thioredoxin-disulfide reductase [Candidatus Dependentiae bacterium]|nr:thioredoxin-disulfide reductase [Candidatus Dependentiae bacterium]